MTADTWLRVFRKEYLSGFVASGGSCVKFVVAEPSLLRGDLAAAIAAHAKAEQFRHIHLDSATTKLHLIDKLFHGIAARTDWPAEVMSFLTSELRRCGHRVTPDRGRLDLASLAAKNQGGEAKALKDLQAALQRTVIEDLDLSIEFRYAVLHMALSHIYRDGKPLSEMESFILGWLRGELSSIVSLKKASIFQRIGRHNARHLLYSLAKWLGKCDSRGLVLTLDVSRYLQTVKTADRREGFYYTPANTSDLYEILRECIDDIDSASGIAVLVLATPALLTDERRGLDMYQALKMRVWDDVRVRGHENPVGPLVRLTDREDANAA